MGKCANCGHKAWGFSPTQCKNCGKEMCDKCGTFLFKLWDVNYSRIFDAWYVCSQECLQNFASQIERHLSAADVRISQQRSLRLALGKIPSWVEGTLSKLDHQEYLGEDFAKLKSATTPFRVNFSAQDNAEEETKGNMLWEMLKKHVRLLLIQNLIATRSFEAAAKLYEEIGMHEEAAKTREKLSEEKELLRGKILGANDTIVLTPKRLTIGERSIELDGMLEVYAEQERLESKMVLRLKNGETEECTIIPEKTVSALTFLGGSLGDQESEMRAHCKAATDRWVNLINRLLTNK